MNPNALLSRIQQALDNDEPQAAREAALILYGWLGARGSSPAWSRYRDAAKWYKSYD